MTTRRTFGRTWWGRAWVDALETRAELDPNRLPRGRTYVRREAVGQLTLAPGRILAGVRGSRPRPYTVLVKIRMFGPDEWALLLDTIAGRIGHAAALLDGELPPEVVDELAEVGIDLLPGPGDVEPACSCPDWADPCKHAAAVCYVVAEALDEDPFSLLLLRGRGREEVLAGLRARRRGADTVDRPAEPADQGIVAADAFAWAGRPPLPLPPLPPPRVGRPAVLGVDPPTGSGLTREVLTLLAADAAARAHELALGTGDGGLDLDVATDVARRAADSLGGRGFAQLASASRIPARELARQALAWRVGGTEAVQVLVMAWDPPEEALAEGRAAIGEPARIWRNRVSRGSRQIRLDREGLWHRYRKVSDGWEPDTSYSPDPDPRRVAR